jgi:hypothetical protein
LSPSAKFLDREWLVLQPAVVAPRDAVSGEAPVREAPRAFERPVAIEPRRPVQSRPCKNRKRVDDRRDTGSADRHGTMSDASAAAARKPCCICAEPGGKHCTTCKSRHYCSKKCQLVDWSERGHKAQCRQMAAAFQDRLLDEIMPEKLKIKEEPPIVEDVVPAAGSRAGPRLPAARTATTAVVEASAPNDVTSDWRGTCAICLEVLPSGDETQRFYECCCKTICWDCGVKCWQHDQRCPLCRSAPCKSNAERLRRVQKHVDKGNTIAQIMLGNAYRDGDMGLKKSLKRAAQSFELAATQGHAVAEALLGCCYEHGDGVTLNLKTAARWYRRSAEQGYPTAQYNLGTLCYKGQGVAQSNEEAVKWWRLAAAQGDAEVLFLLGSCYANGSGVAKDLREALRLFERAAALGVAGAAAMVEQLAAHLADNEGRGQA